MTLMMVNSSTPTYLFNTSDVTSGSVLPRANLYARALNVDQGIWYRVLDGGVLVVEPQGTVTVSGGSLTVTGGSVTISGSPILGSSENHIGQVGGAGGIVTGSFSGSSGSFVAIANGVICATGGSPLEIKNFFRNINQAAYCSDIDVISSASGITCAFKVILLNGIPSTLQTNNIAYIEKYTDTSYKQGIFSMPNMYSATGVGTDCSVISTTDTYTNSSRPFIKCIPNGSTSLYVWLINTSSVNIPLNTNWTVKLRSEQD